MAVALERRLRRRLTRCKQPIVTSKHWVILASLYRQFTAPRVPRKRKTWRSLRRGAAAMGWQRAGHVVCAVIVPYAGGLHVASAST